MREFLILAFLCLLVISSQLFAQYQVGDIVDDVSWTDSNGEDHSIYELTASGKAVVFFWGSTG